MIRPLTTSGCCRSLLFAIVGWFFVFPTSRVQASSCHPSERPELHAFRFIASSFDGIEQPRLENLYPRSDETSPRLAPCEGRSEEAKSVEVSHLEFECTRRDGWEYDLSHESRSFEYRAPQTAVTLLSRLERPPRSIFLLS